MPRYAVVLTLAGGILFAARGQLAWSISWSLAGPVW
jgi:hypothetical protein